MMIPEEVLGLWVGVLSKVKNSIPPTRELGCDDRGIELTRACVHTGLTKSVEDAFQHQQVARTRGPSPSSEGIPTSTVVPNSPTKAVASEEPEKITTRSPGFLCGELSRAERKTTRGQVASAPPFSLTSTHHPSCGKVLPTTVRLQQQSCCTSAPRQGKSRDLLRQESRRHSRFCDQQHLETHQKTHNLNVGGKTSKRETLASPAFLVPRAALTVSMGLHMARRATEVTRGLFVF